MTLPQPRAPASLAVVAVITCLGFASVYIARQDVIERASLTYGIFFLCLYLAAHLVLRLTVPNADPYLLPLVSLLTAIGVIEIYRIEPTDALRQTAWIVVGAAAMSAALFVFAPRLPQARELQVRLRRRGADPPRPPRAAGDRPHRERRAALGRIWPLGFQPGELAKVFLIVFLAAYLREKREVLAQARLKDLGPLLLFFGAAMLVIVETNDLGSALPLLRNLPRDALRGDRPSAVRRRGSRAVRGRRCARVHVDRPRRPARRHVARPVRRSARRGLSARAGALLDRQRRLRRDRARSRNVHEPRGHSLHPVPRHRLHLRGARPGARAHRHRRLPARLHGALPARASARRSSRRTASRSSSPSASRSASRCRPSSSSAACCA